MGRVLLTGTNWACAAQQESTVSTRSFDTPPPLVHRAVQAGAGIWSKRCQQSWAKHSVHLLRSLVGASPCQVEYLNGLDVLAWQLFTPLLAETHL